MDVAARTEALEAENDRLRLRVEELERALGVGFLAPLEWGLTASEMRLFGVMLARDIATKDACMAALYGDISWDDQPQVKIVDVLVCKARKKLKAFDVAIETVWGQGYRLAPEVKARVRRMLVAPA